MKKDLYLEISRLLTRFEDRLTALEQKYNIDSSCEHEFEVFPAASFAYCKHCPYKVPISSLNPK